MKNNILLMQTIILVFCLYAMYNYVYTDNFTNNVTESTIKPSTIKKSRKNIMYGIYGRENKYFPCENNNIDSSQYSYLLR